jgi:hypothetical protein
MDHLAAAQMGGADPNATWSPVSGSVSVTVSASGSATVGPTVSWTGREAEFAAAQQRQAMLTVTVTPPPTITVTPGPTITVTAGEFDKLAAAQHAQHAQMAQMAQMQRGQWEAAQRGQMAAAQQMGGADPNATWSPVSGSVSVTVSASGSATVGPTVSWTGREAELAARSQVMQRPDMM